MWCAHCQDDIATEISEDGQLLKCTTCGEVVRQIFAPSLHPETQSARELLKKWAEEQRLAVGTSPAESEPSVSSVSGAVPPTVPSEPERDSHLELEQQGPEPLIAEELPVTDQQAVANRVRPKYRIDGAHLPVVHAPSSAEVPTEPAAETPPGIELQTLDSLQKSTQVVDNKESAEIRPDIQNDPSPSPPDSHLGHDEAAVANTADSEIDFTFRSEQAGNSNHSDRPEIPLHSQPAVEEELHPMARQKFRDDEEHADFPAPHFDVNECGRRAKSRPGRVESVWGQLMAYAGVGVLTVGTVFVLWGYFGAVEHFASTGWLIATAGQMLLLLGIVTLISGGMQQTTHEVTERIEYLGGRMIRIEQSTEQLLKGPHFLQRRESSFATEDLDQGEQGLVG